MLLEEIRRFQNEIIHKNLLRKVSEIIALLLVEVLPFTAKHSLRFYEKIHQISTEKTVIEIYCF